MACCFIPAALGFRAVPPGRPTVRVKGSNIRDGKHGSDALGWAEFLKQSEIVVLLKPSPR
jgi:hypothetical protein